MFDIDEKIPVTFILSLGGHTFEALSLIDKLEWFVSPSYIICDDNMFAEHKIKVRGPIKYIKSSFSRVRDRNMLVLFLDVFRFVRSFCESLSGFRKFRNEAFVSLGSGTSLAPMIAAKILRKKVIYIESACRVHTRSLFGSLAYRFLVDLFLVQWEEQLKVYPKAIYAGRPF